MADVDSGADGIGGEKVTQTLCVRFTQGEVDMIREEVKRDGPGSSIRKVIVGGLLTRGASNDHRGVVSLCRMSTAGEIEKLDKMISDAESLKKVLLEKEARLQEQSDNVYNLYKFARYTHLANMYISSKLNDDGKVSLKEWRGMMVELDNAPEEVREKYENMTSRNLKIKWFESSEDTVDVPVGSFPERRARSPKPDDGGNAAEQSSSVSQE